MSLREAHQLREKISPEIRIVVENARHKLVSAELVVYLNVGIPTYPLYRHIVTRGGHIR